uniref:Uncharacterized protein n=1 Tax=Anguilla anguilla TaxID=7936 RepID=A0A0E9UZE5_ANGAN
MLLIFVTYRNCQFSFILEGPDKLTDASDFQSLPLLATWTCPASPEGQRWQLSLKSKCA